MKATTKDLRIHSKGLLDAVSKGEDVVITFRGKPCARLVPYEKTDKSADVDSKNNLFGIWADRNDIESVDEYVQNLRKGSSLLGCSKITFI
ncbi:MAG: type II toxin-antitoxin system prevent-host-death family antitoxin [Methylobacter sp.]|nr:type II toxin-antitoxin system prevent-host-death family antitoxin [Methylobacter sp.]